MTASKDVQRKGFLHSRTLKLPTSVHLVFLRKIFFAALVSLARGQKKTKRRCVSKDTVAASSSQIKQILLAISSYLPLPIPPRTN